MLLELFLAGFWCGSQLRECLKYSKMVILFAEVSEVVIGVLLVDVGEHMIIMIVVWSKINEVSVIHEDEDC